MDAIWRDLKHACRMLHRTPTFTLATVLTLTLGMGANNANLQCRRKRASAAASLEGPFQAGSTLEYIPARDSAGGQLGGRFSGFPAAVPNAVRDGCICRHSGWLEFYGRGPAGAIRDEVCDIRLVSDVGNRAVAGPGFTYAEDNPGMPLTVLVSHQLWQKRFGSDPATLNGQQQRALPDTHKNFGVLITPLGDSSARKLRPALLILSGAVGLVLLVACADFVNLLMARNTARQRELAARMALGASRWRLLGYSLTESVLLALLGGICGAALAEAGLRVISALVPPDLAGASDGGLNVWVLTFTLALSILSGIGCGLISLFRYQDSTCTTC